MLVGTFMAFDRHMNIVLGDTEEYRRIKSKKGQVVLMMMTKCLSSLFHKTRNESFIIQKSLFTEGNFGRERGEEKFRINSAER
jgi:small nuclear ribonucleoprotein (snRNP)-like protein